MNYFENLHTLFSENYIFTAISLGMFFVFICGMTAPLLYLAGEKSAYLFDSMQISSYLDKTAMPESIRLKILFLSFPKEQKAIFAEYLKQPTERPTKLFSKTIEQLKCEILEKVDYNKSVAMFFFLISGMTILASNMQTIEVKLLGIFAIALILFCTDVACFATYALVKYFSYRAFKKLTYKLDDFHSLYKSKYQSGLFPAQTKDSPFLKTAMETLKSQPSPQQAQPTPSIVPQPVSILQKRPQQLPPISPPQTTLQEHSPNTTDVASLLKQIEKATTDLDFGAFGILSNQLAQLSASPTLSQTDHNTLQTALDKYLDEFREIEKKGMGV